MAYPSVKHLLFPFLMSSSFTTYMDVVSILVKQTRRIIAYLSQKVDETNEVNTVWLLHISTTG